MVAYKANRPDAELVDAIMSPMSGLSSLYKAVGPSRCQYPATEGELMSFNPLGAITGGVSGFFGSGGNPIGAAIGAIGGGFGGGGSSGGGGSFSGGGQAAGYQGSPLDFYAGTEPGQQQQNNNPLTLRHQNSVLPYKAPLTVKPFAAQALQQGSATALADAATRGNTATQLQASEVAQLLQKGIRLQEDLGKARLGVAPLGPQYMAQAATAARTGDNELAKSLGETNLGIRALQEASKANIAQQFSKDLGTLATTRAAAQSALAQGAQRIAGQLQLGDQNIMGNLTLNKVRPKVTSLVFVQTRLRRKT